MKRTYKKKSNLINKTGYTPGYDTEKNPVNYIPSEDITMANTPYPLYATPLDENGNPIGKGMMMQPGGEYKFPGASYVAETPMFKDGGKSDWISAKISTLVKEGYPQKQAVAIAYSMYEDAKKEQGGYQLPMYLTAGTYNFGSGLPKPKFSADPNIATPEQFSEQMNKITEVNPGKYGLGKDPNYVSPLSEESLTAGQDFKKRTDEIGKAAGLPQDFSKNIFGETTTENTEDKSKVAPPDIKGGEPFQFFNPYSGFDIPTAASTLGSSIESGDTLGTVASGLKLATGLARNFFGGMGQERRKNYLTQQSYEKQREGMTGAGREEMKKFGGYYQEGGMQPGMEQQGGSQEEQIMQQVAQALQQGMSPEEVMQQLIQMGMSEEQAVGLIQSLMQQMQPSTPQLKRGGMMYYQDGGEEPTDWYEEGMDKDTYYGLKNQLEAEGYKSVPKSEDKEDVYSEEYKQFERDSDRWEEEEEEPTYNKNSARDTWVAKTGMPWSEAKRLGYTDGSAKDNTKLLSELNDPRFKKDYLRKKPLTTTKKKEAEDNKTYFGGVLKEVVITAPRKKKGASRFMFTSDKAYQDYLKANNIKEPKADSNNPFPMPTFDFSPKQKEQPMFRQGYQDGGYGEGDMVRYGGGNTGIEKKDLKALAKKYNKTPEDFLDIISNGDVREGGSMIRMGGANTGVPANWREEYKKSKPSTTGFRGALNKGLDYIGVDPIFNMGGYYQDGGEQQVAQQVAQAMQQGMQPQEAMAMLVESGMTEDQAMQLVQAIMQQIQQQGGMEEGTPQMRRGGEMIRRKDGSYSRRGLWDNIRDNRGSGKAPTREMLEQEAKIKREYQEGGMEPGADPAEAMMQQISQMLQQGAEPEQIMQMLIEAGVPEDQAMQMVQAVMEQIQEPQGTPQMRRGGGYYQEGGEEMDEQMEGEDEGAEGESPNMEQIEDQVEQALQQGADPQQVLQQLVEMGIPEEQAMQMIQEILQEIQGGETDMEEPEEGTPQMSKGGKYMRALVGKTIKNYTYNPKTDSYIVSYE
jgi:hypothetical protein